MRALLQRKQHNQRRSRRKQGSTKKPSRSLRPCPRPAKTARVESLTITLPHTDNSLHETEQDIRANAAIDFPTRFTHTRALYSMREDESRYHEVFDNDTSRRCTAQITAASETVDTEVRILLSLRGDRNIVQLIHIQPLDSSQFQLFFDGPPRTRLSDFLETSASTQLTEFHIQTITYQILAGLKHLHDMNFAHCDLTTANVLINESCQVQLRGFGAARHFDDRVDVAVPVPKFGRRDRYSLTRQSRTIWVHSSASCPEEIIMEMIATRADLTHKNVLDRPYTREGSSLCVSGMARKFNLNIGRDATNLVSKYLSVGIPECVSMCKDMWSVGCILAKMEMRSPDRHLFYRNVTDAPTLTLASMFSVIGNPSEDSIKLMPTPAWREAVRSACDLNTSQMRLDSMVVRAGREARSLMKRLLSFDPSERQTVVDALGHPFFVAVRNAQ